MGFDKSKEKKAYLKKTFGDSFVFYRSDKEYCIKNPNPKCVHIHDGAINFEKIISNATKFNRNNGRYIITQLIDGIRFYLEFFALNVVVFDFHNRPKIKEIDLTRSYKTDVRLFGEVNFTKFPLCDDKRLRELDRYKKELTKIVNCKGKFKVYSKLGQNTRRKGEKKKLDALKVAYSELINNLNNKIRHVEGNIERNPIDSWREGKGVKENRIKVLNFLGLGFTKYLMETPFRPQGSEFIFDGVQHFGKGCYESIVLTTPPLDQFKNEKKVVVTSKSGLSSCLGEGEQSAMYYVHKFKDTYTHFAIHSTDTDFYAYVGLFYVFPENENVNIFLRCKNFYNKPRYKPMRGWECALYYVNMRRMSRSIQQKYKKTQRYPILTFWIFNGILFGNDFISKVHSTFQQPNQKSESVTKFLEYWLDTVLLSKKYGNFAMYEERESTNYIGNKEYVIKLAVPLIFKAMKDYLKTFKVKFTQVLKKKLLVVCLNAQYVANYFVNQSRLKTGKMRQSLVYNCCAEDNTGCNIYGYRTDPITKKVIQSQRPPMTYYKQLGIRV